MFQVANFSCDLTHVSGVLTALLPPFFQPHPFLFASACVFFIPACTYVQVGPFFLNLLYHTKNQTRTGPRLHPPAATAPPASFLRMCDTEQRLRRTADNPPTKPQPTNAGGLDIFQPERNNENKSGMRAPPPPPAPSPPSSAAPRSPPALRGTKRRKGEWLRDSERRPSPCFVAYLLTHLKLINGVASARGLRRRAAASDNVRPSRSLQQIGRAAPLHALY